MGDSNWKFDDLLEELSSNLLHTKWSLIRVTFWRVKPENWSESLVNIVSEYANYAELDMYGRQMFTKPVLDKSFSLASARFVWVSP